MSNYQRWSPHLTSPATSQRNTKLREADRDLALVLTIEEAHTIQDCEATVLARKVIPVWPKVGSSLG